MAKVILICGKIASGKSYFADKLKKENNAVILSCDELFKMIFKDDQGEKHDEITKRIREYIYKKSVEIVRAGTDVILEFGFWSRENRKCVSEYYKQCGIQTEWYYIMISDDDWKLNINERNKEVLAGRSDAFFVDDGLLQKMNNLFEEPMESEIDHFYNNKR